MKVIGTKEVRVELALKKTRDGENMKRDTLKLPQIRRKK